MTTQSLLATFVAPDQALATIEDRVRVLTILADMLAHEPEHQDKVVAARDCILVMGQGVGKLKRRGAPPRPPLRRA